MYSVIRSMRQYAHIHTFFSCQCSLPIFARECYLLETNLDETLETKL